MVYQRWRDANKEKTVDFKEKAEEEKKKKKKEKKEKACCAMNRSTKDTGLFFDTAASLHYTYFKT